MAKHEKIECSNRERKESYTLYSSLKRKMDCNMLYNNENALKKAFYKSLKIGSVCSKEEYTHKQVYFEDIVTN